MQVIPAEPFFPALLGMVIGAVPIVILAVVIILRSRKHWVGEVTVAASLGLLLVWTFVGGSFFTQQNAAMREELAVAELQRVYGLDLAQANQILSQGHGGFLGYTQAPDPGDTVPELPVELDTEDGPIRVNIMWRDGFRLFQFDREYGFVELERQ